MSNLLVSGLPTGASIVLYDGRRPSPGVCQPPRSRGWISRSQYLAQLSTSFDSTT